MIHKSPLAVGLRPPIQQPERSPPITSRFRTHDFPCNHNDTNNDDDNDDNSNNNSSSNNDNNNNTHDNKNNTNSNNNHDHNDNDNPLLCRRAFPAHWHCGNSEVKISFDAIQYHAILARHG